jgi:gluconate 2-dehydrogenase gamma chain
MNHETVSRRKFFKKAVSGGMGLAMGTALFEQIADLWVARAEQGSASLDLHQMVTLGAIAAQVIPTDDTPGAREAGVVDYINTKLKDAPSLQRLYQNGLQDVDNLSKNRFSGLFASLDAPQQKEVLKSLESSQFFAQVWKDTVEGFTRSSVGKAVVGYPGGAQPHGYHDIWSPPKNS